ncbi:hypothetical protein Taro_017323, partial [Colocasia esculenta]|nr:hypothetical protein [Colocasia esculenta]
VFLRAQDYELWKIISKGPYELPADEDTWTREQIRKGTLNWSALNMILYTVHQKEYSRVSTCKSAKEMWDKVELIYVGEKTLSELLSASYDGGRITLHEVMTDVQHPIRSILPSGILQGVALKDMEDRISSQEDYNHLFIYGFVSLYCLILILWEIWKGRCSARFESKRFSARSVMNNIKFIVANSLAKLCFKDAPSSNELQVLNQFGFSPQFSPKRLKLVRWIPPITGLCLNVDGASKGNPGLCGGGGCIHDEHGSVRVAFAHFYDDSTSMIVETRALCDGLRLADFLGLRLSIRIKLLKKMMYTTNYSQRKIQHGLSVNGQINMYYFHVPRLFLKPPRAMATNGTFVQPYAGMGDGGQPWVDSGRPRFGWDLWVHCLNEIEPLHLRLAARTLGLH